MTIIVIAIIAVGVTSIYQDAILPREDHSLKVAVTIPPQAEHVEEIGGEKVDVIIMIPPGEDPHHYDPEPKRLQRLEEADIYYKLGSGIEFEVKHMDTLKEHNPGMTIIDSSKGIDLIEMEDYSHDHNDTHGKDPHIWMSPKNVITIVNNMVAGIKDEDPANAEYYERNAEEYLEKWKEFDERIEKELFEYEDRAFIIFHPSMGYFAYDYGLEQISIEVEGKEPGFRDIKEIIDRAKEENIKTVYVSPEFPKEDAKVIAEEIDGEVSEINPLRSDHLANLNEIFQVLMESFE